MVTMRTIVIMIILTVFLVGCQETQTSNTDIPKDCITWFDGCNTCAVTVSGLACTKKYCETMEEPRCIAYDVKSMLEKLDVPEAYTVSQSGYDTGFAGATEAYSYNVTFDVSNEDISMDSKHTLYTITDIKDMIWSLEFDPNVLVQGEDDLCFIHEQRGVSAAYVCFEGSHLYYFEQLNTKGNHQSEGLVWKTKDIQEHEDCDDSRSIFCNVFYNALLYDEKGCDYITQSYCDIVHDMVHS